MSSLVTVHGDLFAQNVDAIVNPVNCVGVMGAGLALSFKTRFPSMFESYQSICKNGGLVPGTVHLSDVSIDGAKRLVINLPTKLHWRDPSTVALVEAGLSALVDVAHERGLQSIAMPALGCGLGGLKLCDVMPFMRGAAERLPSTELRLVLTGKS
jgi:O-acetyl-ADP-ribose deacetylase (regulator of RNase III)